MTSFSGFGFFPGASRKCVFSFPNIPMEKLEAPFKMLACEEAAKQVLTAERILEGWVSKAHPAFANREWSLGDHSGLACIFRTNARQLPLSPPQVTHKPRALL